MIDADLFALTIYSEARGESQDGKVAVGRVIANRMARRYQSDGTVTGTCLHPYAFSEFMFEMVNGVYTKVAEGPEQMQARAETMLVKAKADPVWGACVAAASDALMSTGEEILPDDAVLYCNLAITPNRPAWADPAKEVAVIGHHTFFTA